MYTLQQLSQWLVLQVAKCCILVSGFCLQIVVLAI